MLFAFLGMDVHVVKSLKFDFRFIFLGAPKYRRRDVMDEWHNLKGPEAVLHINLMTYFYFRLEITLMTLCFLLLLLCGGYMVQW